MPQQSRCYRFRAECVADVSALLERLPFNKVVIRQLRAELPDVVVTLTTRLSLACVFTVMKQVEDSHVMYQTLALKRCYTGQRDYDLE